MIVYQLIDETHKIEKVNEKIKSKQTFTSRVTKGRRSGLVNHWRAQFKYTRNIEYIAFDTELCERSCFIFHVSSKA